MAAHGPGDPPGPASLRPLPDAWPTDAELIARSVDDPTEFAPLFHR
jgi:hypothetical protein